MISALVHLGIDQIPRTEQPPTLIFVDKWFGFRTGQVPDRSIRTLKEMNKFAPERFVFTQDVQLD